MTKADDLDKLIDELGLKAVVALLVNVCRARADRLDRIIGDVGEKALNWRSDASILNATIRRLRN